MKFLEEIAEYVAGLDEASLPGTTVVFPNRRAGLFFRQYLSQKISKPVWSPAVMGISDFVQSHSTLRVPDRITLIYELYRQFRAAIKSNESFDRFYFWGEIILRDFDEVDRYLVDPRALYRNLAEMKDIDHQFQYLSEEQRKHIQSFWHSLGNSDSDHKRHFIEIWQQLPAIYSGFQSALLDKGLAYEGLIYRKVAEDVSAEAQSGHVVFAGFNALSETETRIISWYVRERPAKIFWDLDDYYFKAEKQEAGYFARLLSHGSEDLSQTFKESYGNTFAEGVRKKIVALGAPSDTGQAQIVSELLQSIGAEDDAALHQDTAVVLPDEQLLLPVLHALPEQVQHVNITMGYPLRHALAYNFIEHLVALQSGKKKGPYFYYKHVLGLLRHPFLKASGSSDSLETADAINRRNMIWVHSDMLPKSSPLLETMFSDAGEGVLLVDYVRQLLLLAAPAVQSTVQREMLAVCYRTLNNLRDFFEKYALNLAGEGFVALFRQIMYSIRVPFEGEPLQGTQIMGFLETRNLDFKHVIVCSMNEDIVPPARSQSSFIPTGLRRGFGLPTFDHHDALYAYLFYRQIQRAEKIYLVYNSSAGNGTTGEMSRYIRQLQKESGVEVQHGFFSARVFAEMDRSINLQKSRATNARLLEYTDACAGAPRHLTPSALNTYLDCSLRFYFRYVARIYEEEVVQDEMDPMAFGKIFHDTMEHVYDSIAGPDVRIITPQHVEIIMQQIDRHIESAFARHFNQGGNTAFHFTGPNAVAREVVKKMAMRVLEHDRQYAPFEVIGLESKYVHGVRVPLDTPHGTLTIRLGGIVDRIDRKNGVVRVLDYKTGKDEKKIENITSLFNREDASRNKAAFQTFLYCLIVKNNLKNPGGTLQPGLYNMREIFANNFSYLFRIKKGRGASDEIEDVNPLLDEFEENIRGLLSEIFAPVGTYTQTDDMRKCVYCPYKGLCRR
jgi:hypothetical protein